MRKIKLTVEDVDLTYADVGNGLIRLTGTDVDTADLVTFAGTAHTMLDLIDRVRVLRGTVADVHDFQVTNVEPVRGEWDSPGTSPEDGA
jgi:hypothetical protein